MLICAPLQPTSTTPSTKNAHFALHNLKKKKNEEAREVQLTMDAKPTPAKPTPLSTSSTDAQSTQHAEASPKSPARSPDSLLKSPSAFEQKPLRMPKPMSI